MNLHIIFAGAVVGIALLMALSSLSSAQTKADATRPRARSLECGFGEERRALVADFRDPEPGGRVCIPQWRRFENACGPPAPTAGDVRGPDSGRQRRPPYRSRRWWHPGGDHGSSGTRTPRKRRRLSLDWSGPITRGSATRQDTPRSESFSCRSRRQSVGTRARHLGLRDRGDGWLFAKLAEGRPSVTIVANGGGITLTEVESNVRAGRRIILIEGSGRAADALVSLLQKTQVSDAEVVGLRERAEKATLTRRPELFQIVGMQRGAPGLRDAITAVIGGTQ